MVSTAPGSPGQYKFRGIGFLGRGYVGNLLAGAGNTGGGSQLFYILAGNVATVTVLKTV